MKNHFDVLIFLVLLPWNICVGSARPDPEDNPLKDDPVLPECIQKSFGVIDSCGTDLENELLQHGLRNNKIDQKDFCCGIRRFRSCIDSKVSSTSCDMDLKEEMKVLIHEAIQEILAKKTNEYGFPGVDCELESSDTSECWSPPMSPFLIAFYSICGVIGVLFVCVGCVRAFSKARDTVPPYRALVNPSSNP